MHPWVPIVFPLGESKMVVDFFVIFIFLDVSPSSSQCWPPGSYMVGPKFKLMCFFV
jgi:hypothetical protein